MKSRIALWRDGTGGSRRPGSSSLSFHFGPETKSIRETLAGLRCCLQAGYVAGQSNVVGSIMDEKSRNDW